MSYTQSLFSNTPSPFAIALSQIDNAIDAIKSNDSPIQRIKIVTETINLNSATLSVLYSKKAFNKAHRVPKTREKNISKIYKDAINILNNELKGTQWIATCASPNFYSADYNHAADADYVFFEDHYEVMNVILNKRPA